MLEDKNEKIFKYVQLRMRENFFNTWYYVFQQCATFMVPAILTFIWVTKLISFNFSPTFLEDSTYLNQPKVDFASSGPIYDFSILRSQVEEGTIKKDLSNLNLFHPDNKVMLTEVIQEISRKGIVPNMYYLALAEFVVFWYFFATLFTSSFALLYYRKFKAV